MNNIRFFVTDSNKYKSSGLSLAELLIATSLLTLILFTVGILDMASRKFYSKAEKGAAALQDVSLAMEYIQKSAQRAIGDVSSGHPAYESDADGTDFCAGYTKGCRFVIDVNQNGIWEDPTTTDGYNTFCYNDNLTVPKNTLTLLETGEIIARRLVLFYEDNVTQPGVVFFRLASRDNPSAAASVDNPDVYLEARVYFRSASLQ